MDTKHALAAEHWALTERHSQLEYMERLLIRHFPLTTGEARACELATGSSCTCRCGGWLHGIYRDIMVAPPSSKDPATD